MPITLDIRDWPSKGLQLAKDIEDACGSQSRSALLGALFNELRLSPEQLMDLSTHGYGGLPKFENKIYVTKYNAMDIKTNDTILLGVK